MSEHQLALAGIEARLDALVSGQGELRADVLAVRAGQTELRTEVAGLHTGQTELRAGQHELRAGFDQLVVGQDELRVGQISLGNRFDRLERKTEIALEQLQDEVRHIAEGHTALEIKMDKGFAELREDLDRRLYPLERTVRDHTTSLKKHDLME